MRLKAGDDEEEFPRPSPRIRVDFFKIGTTLAKMAAVYSRRAPKGSGEAGQAAGERPKFADMPERAGFMRCRDFPYDHRMELTLSKVDGRRQSAGRGPMT